MKVGDYITVQKIVNQSVCRWVVLIDLKDDIYGGVEGGIIKHIADTKREAGDISAELTLNGADTYLVCGAIQPLCVGGVFAE